MTTIIYDNAPCSTQPQIYSNLIEYLGKGVLEAGSDAMLEEETVHEIVDRLDGTEVVKKTIKMKTNDDHLLLVNSVFFFSRTKRKSKDSLDVLFVRPDY